MITNTCGQQVPPGVPVAPSIPKGSVRCVLGVRWGPSPFVHLRGGRKTTKVCPGVFCLGFLSPNGRLRSGRPPNRAVCVWAAARLADVVVSRLVSPSFLIWPFTVSLAFYRLLFRGGDRLPFSRFVISTKPTWKRRKRFLSGYASDLLPLLTSAALMNPATKRQDAAITYDLHPPIMEKKKQTKARSNVAQTGARLSLHLASTFPGRTGRLQERDPTALRTSDGSCSSGTR